MSKDINNKKFTDMFKKEIRKDGRVFIGYEHSDELKSPHVFMRYRAFRRLSDNTTWVVVHDYKYKNTLKLTEEEREFLGGRKNYLVGKKLLDGFRGNIKNGIYEYQEFLKMREQAFEDFANTLD